MIDETAHISARKSPLMLSWKEHLFFWLVTLLFFATLVYVMDYQVKSVIYTKLFFLPFQLIGAYFMIYILLGRYIYRFKYIQAVIGFVVFIFLYSFLVYYVHDYYFRVAFIEGFTPPTFVEMLGNFEALVIYYMNRSLTLPLILVCMEFVAYQYNRIKEIELLQIQKNAAELNLLKTQIHPNFLLSTLRNLENLAAVESDSTTTVIEKLSDTLDYILYKGQTDKVQLKEELQAMKEYVDLENIRFEPECNISLVSAIENEQIKITPLIVFSFLEYNFKRFQKQNIPYSSCEIDIIQSDNKLFVEISNSYKSSLDPSFRSGYEMNKMERQLEISNPDRFVISEVINGNKIIIKLELNL